MLMMKDCEEHLDDFPARNKEKPAESMVGTHRADRSMYSRKWNHNEDSTSL